MFSKLVIRNKITVINYHNPKKQVISKHLYYFSKHYNFISADQLIEALKFNNLKKLPSKPMLVTFDDGYAENIELSAILKQYKVPAIIYIASGAANTKRTLWFKHENLKNSTRVLSSLKKMNNESRIKYMWDNYRYKFETSNEEHASILNKEQILQLIQSGCSIGAHTKTHPILTKCSEDMCYAECLASKQELESLLSIPVKHFAYPNGNYDNNVKKIIEDIGFSSGRTINPGWVTGKTDLYEIKNFGISDDACLSKAILQASGIWYILKYFITLFKKL